MVKSTSDKVDVLKTIVDAVENDFSEEDIKNGRIKWIDMSMKRIGVEKLAEEYIIRFTIERKEENKDGNSK